MQKRKATAFDQNSLKDAKDSSKTSNVGEDVKIDAADNAIEMLKRIRDNPTSIAGEEKVELYSQVRKEMVRADRKGEGDHVCLWPGCAKAFVKPSQLERHSRIHTVKLFA
jgi:hypothetical protein